jgi:DNA-directed RNA polymerase II subunit RPB3
VSENSKLEPTPDETDRFDYAAEPDRFYINLETVGGIDAETCFQQGIRVLQQKVAAVIQELSPGGQANGADEYVPRSPDAPAMGQGGYTSYGGGASAWGGGTTPFGSGAGGGATTPYGGGATQYGATTPYGQGGW